MIRQSDRERRAPRIAGRLVAGISGVALGLALMLGGAGAGAGAEECSNPPGIPTVANVTPPDGGEDVFLDAPITANVNLPNCGGIDRNTLTSDTVKLLKMPQAVPVPATVNSSGGGDVIVVQPSVKLAATTAYTFQVLGGLKDLSGAAFAPFSSTFTTGTSTAPTGNGSFAGTFTKIPTSAPGLTGGPGYTGVVMGPDGKLYAGTNYGEIKRFAVNDDGSLGAEESIDTLAAARGPRVIVGLAFDPASTAANPILWITHNEASFDNAAEWTGVISKLSGPGLGSLQDVVVGLPRSVKDHLTNSLAFKGGMLYLTQGSNSSLGAPDNAWGQRPERLLSATVLRLDPSKLGTLPLNAKTADGGGSYDPFAANAPLTIYATGLRNAYDLVFHSNGSLYAPTNGAAGGGRTPASPAVLPAACQNRIDRAINGVYTGPQVPEVRNVGEQHDYLFRVVEGGYYGHPNAGRCEWVLNGGNPTAAADVNEIGIYPVGTLPDRNYRGAAFDLGLHYSTNGVIEYSSNAFNNGLKGRLMIVRYSSGDDIIVLTPDAQGNIVASQTGIPGLTGFANPLDLTMDPRQGNIYVVEYPDPSTDTRPSRIVLVKATQPGTPPAAGEQPDTVKPTVVSRVPAANAIGVGTAANVGVGFSEAMNPASLSAATFTVAPSAGGAAVAGAISANPGGTGFTFNPTADLATSTSYTVTVTTGAADLAGNGLAATDAWTFTTDTIAGGVNPGPGPGVKGPSSTDKTPTPQARAFCARHPRASAVLARQLKAAKAARTKATTTAARASANTRIALILKKQRKAAADHRRFGCKAIETAAFCKAYPATSRALAKKLTAAKKARTKATTPAARAAATKKVATLSKLQKAAIARHEKRCEA